MPLSWSSLGRLSLGMALLARSRMALVRTIIYVEGPFGNCNNKERVT